MPLLYIAKDKNKEYLSQLKSDNIINFGVRKVDAAGLGCLLIHKRVLDKVKFRFDKKNKAFDDMYFCKDAYDNGFEIFVEMSVKCKHLIKEMDWNKIKK